MEKEEFRLADALEAEKVWTCDGVAVLTASVCLPQLPGDFSVDHLVMSMYRVFSCVVGRGCLL